MYVEFLSDVAVRQNGWSANYNSVTVGINNVLAQDNNISIYPNPFTNNITVDFNLEKESNIEISVMNVLGQTVKKYSTKMNVGNTKQIIDMTELPANSYWIKVIVNDEQKMFKTIKID